LQADIVDAMELKTSDDTKDNWYDNVVGLFQFYGNECDQCCRNDVDQGTHQSSSDQ